MPRSANSHSTNSSIPDSIRSSPRSTLLPTNNEPQLKVTVNNDSNVHRPSLPKRRSSKRNRKINNNDNWRTFLDEIYPSVIQHQSIPMSHDLCELNRLSNEAQLNLKFNRHNLQSRVSGVRKPNSLKYNDINDSIKRKESSSSSSTYSTISKPSFNSNTNSNSKSDFDSVPSLKVTRSNDDDQTRKSVRTKLAKGLKLKSPLR